MSFQKTKRAHALRRGDEIRLEFDECYKQVWTGTVDHIKNEPMLTVIFFDDGRSADVWRDHKVEILNNRG